MNESDYNRAAAKIWKNPETGCWEWQGCTSASGYGVINVDSKNKAVVAHRVSYSIHVGPIPDGMFACHRCDNRICINPAHIFIGTAADNNADMDRKGRRRWSPKFIESAPWRRRKETSS